ncbi:MAG: DUF1330 domain-containing protein [Acidimicrobiia bacterium]|nr:DUF1330 domain-containing protein [Acidimicrobiia bacterium]
MSNGPTREQVVRYVEDSERILGEVVMLNLLKFRERAESVDGGTGKDSYGRYGEVALKKIAERGGTVVWSGTPDQVFIGDEDVNDWDMVVLVAYPNRAAFLEMVADPEYQEGHRDREGGLARTALLAMTPGEGFAAIDEGKGIR